MMLWAKAKMVAAAVTAALVVGGGTGAGLQQLLAGEEVAVEPTAAAGEFKVRKEHPRIWLTPERIERIKAKMQANDPAFQAVKAAAGKDVLCSALMYVLAKDEAYAKKAIKYMMDWKMFGRELEPPNVNPSNNYRWSGHLPIIIYDWCYPLLTAEEKAEFIARYNQYVELYNQKKWGGLHMPHNNYYGGHMRNSGLFAIATYHENDRAKEFFEHARVARWEKSSLPYFEKEGKGGVMGEGPAYSTGNTQYYIAYVDAVQSATGEDLLRQTSFFLEFVYYFVYSTTPQPTVPTPPSGGGEPYYMIFPYGDLENAPGGCRGCGSLDFTDIFLKVAQGCEGKPVSGHAQRYMNKVGAGRGGAIFTLIFADPQRKERDFAELPSDYYVTGMKQLYSRSGWLDGATALSIQCNPHADHGHLDAGSFQLCRKGRWLTKEATGYCVEFSDCGCNDMAAHNGILFGDKGPLQVVYAGYGPPEVVALESRPEYAYLACDLSPFYNFWLQPEECNKRSKHNKTPRDASKVEKCVREFVYLRPDTLVVLDRLVSRGDDIKKTFLLHCVEPPEIKEAEKTAVAPSGDQALFCRTLLPGKTACRVVNMREGVKKIKDGGTYTWRLEVSSAEKEEELFLHVLRVGDKGAQVPEFKLVQAGGEVGVTFAEQGKSYSVLFKDGVNALGGEVSINEGGGNKELVKRALYDKVQGIKVDADGVHWEALP